jgi:cell division septation protein DedD
VQSQRDEQSVENAVGDTKRSQQSNDRRRVAETTGSGYRVQIGIDDNKERMENLVQYARSRVDYPVYLEFEPPFYRVRVGDFRTREEAEQCVRRLKSDGFENALWVMSAINVY